MAQSTIPEGGAASPDLLTAGVVKPGEITKATPFDRKPTVVKHRRPFLFINRDIKEAPPPTPHEAVVAAQRKIPAEFAYAEQQKEPPAITDTSKDMFAEALQRQYRSLLDVGLDKIPPRYWQITFYQILEKKYEIDNPTAKPLRELSNDEIMAYTRQLVNEEQFQTLGEKVVEYHKTLLQAGANAEADIASMPEEITYVSEFKSVDSSGTSEPVTREKLRKSLLRPRHFDPASGEARKARADEIDAFTAEGSKKRFFIGAARLPETAFYKANVEIEGEVLNDFDKALLQQFTQVEPDNMIQAGARRVICEYYDRGTSAQINFYNHLDRQPTEAQVFNLLKKGSKQGEFLFAAPSKRPNIFLEEAGFKKPPGLKTRPQIAVGIGPVDLEQQIHIIQKTLQPELEKLVAEFELKQSAPTSASEIEAKIVELKAHLEKQVAPEEEEAIQKEIIKLQKSVQAAKDVKAKKEETETNIKASQQTQDEIKTAAGITTPDVTTYQDLLGHRKDLAIQQRTITIFETDIEKINKMLGVLPRKTEKILDKDGKVTGEKDIGVQDAYDQREQDLLAALDALVKNTDYVTAVSNNLTLQQSILKEEQTLGTEKIQALDNAAAEIKKQEALTREMTDHKARRISLVKDTGGIEQDEKYWQEQLEKKQGELASKRSDLVIQRQLEAYQALQSKISPEAWAEIQNRAMQTKDMVQYQRQLEQAKAIYPGYTDQYLRTLQVIFGTQVTQATVDGKNMFQQAANLLPPGKFGVIYASVKPAEIDPEFIDQVMDELRADAHNGNLGHLELADIDAIRKIEFETPVADTEKFDKQVETRTTTVTNETTTSETNIATSIIKADKAILTAQSIDVKFVAGVRKAFNDNEGKTDPEIIAALKAVDSSIDDSKATAILAEMRKVPAIQAKEVGYALEQVLKKGGSYETAYSLAAVTACASTEELKALHPQILATTDTDPNAIIASITDTALQTSLKNILTKITAEVTAKKGINTAEDYLRTHVASVIGAVLPSLSKDATLAVVEAIYLQPMINAIVDKEDDLRTVDQLYRETQHAQTVGEIGLAIAISQGLTENEFKTAKVFALEIDKRRQALAPKTETKI